MKKTLLIVTMLVTTLSFGNTSPTNSDTSKQSVPTHYYKSSEVDFPLKIKFDSRELHNYLNEEVIIPQGIDTTNIDRDFRFRIWVNEKGELDSIKLSQFIKSDTALATAVLNAIYFMDEWIPAQKNGEDVAIYTKYAVHFKKGALIKKKRKIFTIVEEPAEYPGGDEAMYKFLADNLTYPDEAAAKGIQGQVLIQVTLDENGNVMEVKPALPEKMHLGYGLEEEAIRVIEIMPKFTPAMQGGKNVAVRFIYPITFVLE